MQSILSKVSKLPKSIPSTATPMTPKQIRQCKAALARDSRGMNIFPNHNDINRPYVVTTKWAHPIFGKEANKYHGFGTFVSADVAAAVASIVSVGFFGATAQTGMYDKDLVERSQEWLDWELDIRNQTIINMAMGGLPTALEVSKNPSLADKLK